MILATVGTHAQGFKRFVELVAALDEDVVLQHGPNPVPEGPNIVRAVPFLPFDEILAYMREAEAVVTHAGVGSILCARGAGHIPVVVPRLERLGEHVDDHQAELTRSLEALGHVVAVWEGDDLKQAIDVASERRNHGYRLGERPLHAAVRAALHVRVS